MASKVLVPTVPFAKLQLKKTPPESSSSGFIIATDPTARVAHLEHSVRFLQEQHRLMLNGLHTEIETLRERNRDLQFQLIFNKEYSAKASPPPIDDSADKNEIAQLKCEVSRLEGEASAARGEARAAEARALQLQRLVDTQAEKLRELEVRARCAECSVEASSGVSGGSGAAGEGASRGELRARLADAERLVRRLRGDADRQRRELQCMKNSLHASLRASGLDAGYYNNYHLPVAADFWREPLREDYTLLGSRGGSTRRPLTLPELSATGQQMRSTVYANNHTRTRANGYENKIKKAQVLNGDAANAKTPDEPPELPRITTPTNDISNKAEHLITECIPTYPELKIVVTKIIPHGRVSVAGSECTRPRPRRHHHRKHATDHT